MLGASSGRVLHPQARRPAGGRGGHRRAGRHRSAGRRGGRAGDRSDAGPHVAGAAVDRSGRADRLGRVRSAGAQGPGRRHPGLPGPATAPHRRRRPAGAGRGPGGRGRAIETTGGKWTDPDPRPGSRPAWAKARPTPPTRARSTCTGCWCGGRWAFASTPICSGPTVAFRVGDQTMRTLTRDDTLLHACSHLLVLGARRALELRDVAQLATRTDLDVEALLIRARQWQAEAILASAVLSDRRGARPRGPVPGRVGSLGGGLSGDAAGSTVDAGRATSGAGAGPGSRGHADRAPQPPGPDRAIRATLRPARGTWATPVQRARWLGRRLIPGP